MQFTSNPLYSKGQGQLVASAKYRLGWNILKYFPSETNSPGCIAYYHFGTITLCLLQISKLTAETNVQKAFITSNSQGSGERSGPNGPVFIIIRGDYRCNLGLDHAEQTL